MSIDGLMEVLAKRDIKLSARAGELSVSASKGALTAELKIALQQHKQEIVELLTSRQGSVELSEVVPNEKDRYAPFPFSDLQVGFYMADNPYMEFHVRPHYYCEQDNQFLDVARYEHALNKALARHKGEIVLVHDDGHLRALREIPPVKCKVNDFRHLSAAEVAVELARIRERFERAQLPLDRWPWFDLEISLWSEQDVEKSRVHINQNNFYTDGFGATVLSNEIDLFYADPDLELPPLQLTLRDAVLALQSLSESALGERAKKYWLDRIPELPEPPSLPQIPSVSRRCRSKLQRRQNTLPAEIWRGFKLHAAQNGLTPSGAVISAYAELIATYSGSRHFILSNMVTRRLPLHKEIRQIVGNFASLYPLEVDWRGELSFAEKALRLQGQILRDSNHLQWGGMQVMQALNRNKGEFGSVPCPFVVGSALFMGSWKKPDYSCLETSQTMLDHQFWELADGGYYYVWDLLEEFFPAGMINEMWQSFDRLLRTLAKNSSAWKQPCRAVAPAGGLALATRHVSLQGADGLLHDGLANAVNNSPTKTVLETLSDSLSYQELDVRSTMLAERLRQRRVAANELVAIVMDRGADLLAAALGILKSGAAYVPIDTALPVERIHYMLKNSGARVVLTQSHYRDNLHWPDGLDILPVDALPPTDRLLAAANTKPTDLAYVIYTSGSTGVPKGVMIDHRAALNTVLDINRRFDVGSSDKVFGVSSFSFDLSVYDVFGVLSAGATLVYPDSNASLNPAHWLELLVEKSVTIWNSAPPLMSLLTETALRQTVQLPALRLVMLSGDWIPLELPALIKRIAPNATIVSLGGATEAAIWSIYYVIDQVEPGWTSIPYGVPLANQGWQIRDAQGRSTPTWTVGELHITGAGLAQGYWRDEEKTRRSFIVDAETGERLYRTGDRGRYLPDGNIEFMGRIDAQVKIQGHRIELGEIEAVLKDNTSIKDAVVLALPVGDPAAAKPNTPKQIVAYVVPQTPMSTDANTPQTTAAIHEWKEFLKQKLPGYMVPVAWSMLDRLPISNNGKIDRAALAKIAHVGMSSLATSSVGYVPPHSETERKLAAIWQEILRKECIGVNQDFFEIGGQSFDAVRSVSLIKENFGKTLSLGDIWQQRTIENLAKRIEAHQLASQRSLVPINSNRSGLAYFLVHPAGGQVIGYHDLGLLLDRPSYGFVATSEDADDDKLSSVEAIARRYVAELKTHQPKGPYSLGGWSSGGCIAYEMAVQLEQAGDVVDRIIMFDSPAPLQHDPIDEAEMLYGFFEDLDLGMALDGVRRRTSDHTDTEAHFTAIVARLNRSGRITLDAKSLYGIYRVFKNVVNAIRRYQARPIRAPIVVLRAAEGSVTEFANHPYAERADWGWSILTSGKTASARVRGSHHTLLRRPNVDAIADQLNDRPVVHDTINRF